ncbi:unnamed protein product [Microthlaspi erraticum]|uniref:F-box domain-containing protein n=1 Tax=Microthlaspi erraticum TaxID=1685480 RepID=A0A6D2KB78_9BRAS|nr:unnamed protein product [Microthlaspi erraticum]
MEETKAKGNCFKEPAGISSAREDMISELPDSLISEILSYLPTKEAVRTCVLSNRWKSLWLLIPGLDFGSSDFPCYKSFERFIDRFLDFKRKENSCLHKLKLIISIMDDQSCATRCIDFVATRKLKHLDVQCECLKVMPLRLYICETLLYLRLHRVSIGSFECVSLPCVKTMRLEKNVYVNDACLESLISSCPVLEDLSIVKRHEDDNVKVLRVHSLTLTSLSIEAGRCEYTGIDYENAGFIIDAPRLKHLNIKDATSKNKTISNLGSLTNVNILCNRCPRYIADYDEVELRNFFTSISGVRDMKISWEASHEFHSIATILQPVQFGSRDLSSPPGRAAKDLIGSWLPEQIKLTTAPRCLMSSLEFVEFVEIKHKNKYTIDPAIKLAMYFAENSVILKKLVLRLGGFIPAEGSEVLRDLMASMTRSSTCQLVVC